MDQAMKATVEPALKIIFNRLTEQIDRLAKNNSQLQSINDKFRQDGTITEVPPKNPSKDSPGIISEFGNHVDVLQMLITDYGKQLNKLSEII